MRLGDGPSDNFEDRTGSSGGMGFGGGGGGNMLGCLLPLVASRFGIVGVLDSAAGILRADPVWRRRGDCCRAAPRPAAPSAKSTLSAENRRILVGTLESTDRRLGEDIRQRRVLATRSRGSSLILRGTQTACGYGQAAAGPFYCPNDAAIYVDPAFFNELSRRFGAPGDAAAAYVIAHEVGHHVQDLAGCSHPGEPAPGAGEQDRGECDSGQGRAAGRLLCRGVGRQRPRFPGLDP